jgi:aminopeptidase N
MMEMKKLLITLLLILMAATTLLAQTDIYSRPEQVERSHNFDAIHYKVSLNFDLEAKKFHGTNQVTLKPLVDNFQQVILDAENLEITAVKTADGQSLEFTHAENILTIELAKSWSYGQELQFVVHYQASNSQKGIFMDEEAEDHPRMVTTDSWPNEARTWFPCYDYPNDKVTAEVIITTDAKWSVLSNGKLISEIDNNDGSKTWHWHQLKPHPTYLSNLAIGPFEVVKLQGHEIPMSAWVYPGKRERAEYVFRKTGKMIKFFEKIYDYKYPWAKYDQVTSSHIGGGMEATSSTVLGQGLVIDKKAEKDYSPERIIAHELAHQWWGDLITLRTWSETWLNESFGTFGDYLWTRFEDGEDAGAYALLGKKNSYLREANNRYIRPIVFTKYDSPQQNFDSHTYPKGAVTLQMLRYLMGDKLFFMSLSHFLHKHEFQPVDTHDLMLAIKEVSGQNYDWFFEQFIYKPGHMILDISSDWDEESKLLKLRVKQVQDFSRGVPVYRMAVTIGLTAGDSKTSEQIWLTKKDETFEFNLAEKPQMVRFDEGNFLLKEWRFEKSLTELIFQASNDDVIGRLWATEQLARFDNHPNALIILQMAATLDPFWAVRNAAMQVLGNITFEDKEKFFVGALDDADSLVRATAVSVLARHFAASNVDRFIKLYQTDNSYRVQAEVVTALGIAGDKAAIPLLKEAVELKSYRSIISRAATKALELLK